MADIQQWQAQQYKKTLESLAQKGDLIEAMLRDGQVDVLDSMVLKPLEDGARKSMVDLDVAKCGSRDVYCAKMEEHRAIVFAVEKIRAKIFEAVSVGKASREALEQMLREEAAEALERKISEEALGASR